MEECPKGLADKSILYAVDKTKIQKVKRGQVACKSVVTNNIQTKSNPV
jgi:hypothetical protein